MTTLKSMLVVWDANGTAAQMNMLPGVVGEQVQKAGHWLKQGPSGGNLTLPGPKVLEEAAGWHHWFEA